MFEFFDQGSHVCVDVEATRKMYSLIDRGENEGCDCGSCGYFVGHRAEAYPPHFRSLLLRLGIDFRKENETPGIEQPEWCLYMGNFDFVGMVVGDARSTGNEPGSTPAYDEFFYSFGDGAGYPWTRRRAEELGFGPIACVSFSVWLPVTFPWSPTAIITAINARHDPTFTGEPHRGGFRQWLKAQFPGIFQGRGGPSQTP